MWFDGEKTFLLQFLVESMLIFLFFSLGKLIFLISLLFFTQAFSSHFIDTIYFLRETIYPTTYIHIEPLNVFTQAFPPV